MRAVAIGWNGSAKKRDRKQSLNNRGCATLCLTTRSGAFPTYHEPNLYSDTRKVAEIQEY